LALGVPDLKSLLPFNRLGGKTEFTHKRFQVAFGSVLDDSPKGGLPSSSLGQSFGVLRPSSAPLFGFADLLDVVWQVGLASFLLQVALKASRL